MPDLRWGIRAAEPDSDQEFFRDTTARFLTEHAPPAEIRRLRDDPVGFGARYWQRGAELGWTSLLVDEEYGGGSISGDGLIDLTLVAHEFGRHAAPGPLVPTNLVAAVLSDDPDGRHGGLLAGLLAGTSIASWCYREPRPGDGLGEIALEVRADGSDVVLNGVKRPVESGEQASHLLVTGRTGSGLTQVLVPAEHRGHLGPPDADGRPDPSLLRGHLPRRAGARRHRGRRDRGGRPVPGRATAPAGTGDGQLGVGRRHAERVGHDHRVGVRPLFVRPAARLLPGAQAPVRRHEDLARGQRTRSATPAAAVASGSADAGELVSAAKAFIGDYGSELVQDCMQIHGGIGLTFEHDIHFYLRRVTVNRALYGTPGRAPTADRRRSSSTCRVRHDARTTSRTWPAFRRAGPVVDPGQSRAGHGARLRKGCSATPAPTRRSWPRSPTTGSCSGRLFDAGLAGICFPTAYGGQGLTPAHQAALNEELVGFEYPMRFQAPTISPCAAVILDFGTEEQKLRHLPAILRGEELWMQFLSEPGGGSDVAGAQTTAVRDGDEWMLNGSKIWTTGAWWSDWGLCLARTNWDVPKHRGLTVFMLPIRQPGIEVHRIEMLNGTKEFCQEFMTDVRVPDTTGSVRWTTAGRSGSVGCSTSGCSQLPLRHRPGRAGPQWRRRRRRCSGSPAAPAGSMTRRSRTSSAKPGCSS